MSSYPNLFQPGRIGALEIPNRIVFAATSTELAEGESKSLGTINLSAPRTGSVLVRDPDGNSVELYERLG